jgi:hypothetical protein
VGARALFRLSGWMILAVALVAVFMLRDHRGGFCAEV